MDLPMKSFKSAWIGQNGEPADYLSQWRSYFSCFKFSSKAITRFRSFFEDNAQQPSLVGLILAFTGAAMIGGLADWFAVVALFRHPMGIPIPRTAIIPERKDTIGKELANFVRDQVLKPEEIKKQLEKSDMTRFAGDWLQKDSNARDVSKAIDWCLDVGSTGNSELRGDFKRMLVGVAQNIPVNEAIATTMHVFATGKNTQPIIGQLTQFGLNQIDHNRERIREKIKEKTRWLLFSEDSKRTSWCSPRNACGNCATHPCQ